MTTDALDLMMKVSLVLFMAGSLLDMGLGLSSQDAMKGLRNPRFMGFGVLFGFVLGPVLAYALTLVIPLDEPYAVGLILLGMTPCAPFLPAMVKRASGDMSYAAAMMLLAGVGTVVFLPLAVPVVVEGLSVDPWTIARPLLAVVLLPLVIGMAILRAAPQAASSLRPMAKKTTAVATIAMLLLCALIYGRNFVGVVGTYAIGSQIVFFGVVTAASYKLGLGLSQPQRSTLGLGMCTRNVGAALAPLFSAAAVDQQAIVMVVLGVPMQIIFSLLAARWFAREARRAVGDASRVPGANGESTRTVERRRDA